MWNNQGGYGDQGGGYMNSPQGQGGNFSSPQGQGGSQQKQARSRAQNIMPVTVAQILMATAEDEKFLVDGVELHQVTIVGIVRTVSESATRLDYQIDDMTGPPIEVRQFLDSDDQAEDQDRVAPMRENMYVRVCGNVRAFGGKRSLVSFRMLPVLDMNELTAHMLEVFHSHLALTKGAPTAAAGAQNQNQSTAGPGNAVNKQASFNAGPAFGNNMQTDANGLTAVQAQVHNIIKGCVDETGVSIQIIMDNLGGMPEKAIREAVDFLSGEGHIYSTIDDEHFKSTDSMD